MSVVICKGEEISRHLANNSLAKQLYSFPKASRFNQTYSREPYKNADYNLCRDLLRTKNFAKLATTFGVDRPDLFFDKEKTLKPAPDVYDIPSACFSNRDSFRSRVKSARVPRSSHSNSDILSRGSASSRRAERTTFGAGRDAYNNVVSANQFNHIPYKPD